MNPRNLLSQDKADKLERENIILNIKMAAAMVIFQSYHDAWVANMSQIIIETHTNGAKMVDRKKAREIDKKMVRELKRLKLDAKEKDRFASPFIKLFEKDDMHETLLDVFANLFEEKIKLDNNIVSINLD